MLLVLPAGATVKWCEAFVALPCAHLRHVGQNSKIRLIVL